MIKFADDNMLNDLKPLWKECFSIDYYSPYGVFYITNIFKNYKPLVYIFDNKPVSMATLMPINLIYKDKILSGFFIYGLGTLKKYRRKNIANEILNYIEKYSKDLNKDFNILIPANNDPILRNMYFKNCFT